MDVVHVVYVVHVVALEEQQMDKTNPYTTIRIWPETRQALRLLSAMRGSSMVRILDEIVQKQLKLEKKEQSRAG